MEEGGEKRAILEPIMKKQNKRGVLQRDKGKTGEDFDKGTELRGGRRNRTVLRRKWVIQKTSEETR